MKRNKTTMRIPRTRPLSRYRDKKARGKQMYGPGCCAHNRYSAAMARGEKG